VSRTNEDSSQTQDLLQRAYELGVEGNEEEFFGGLLRSVAEQAQFDQFVVADEIAADDYLGWASESPQGENRALLCLGIED
jgi:hypothetical protein